MPTPNYGQTGPGQAGDGAQLPLRTGRTGDLIVSELQGRYSESAIRALVYSAVLAATTTGVAAGNIAGAAAAASTQFAIFNPVGSGKNLHLLKFGMGVISGTPGAGPMFHGLYVGVPTLAASFTPINHYTGKASGSVALAYASAAGAALTGGTAPITLRVADFTSTNTAAASVGELKAIEYVDGDIIIAPGNGWVPLWGAAGTTLLNGYSVTWAEIPV